MHVSVPCLLLVVVAFSVFSCVQAQSSPIRLTKTFTWYGLNALGKNQNPYNVTLSMTNSGTIIASCFDVNFTLYIPASSWTVDNDYAQYTFAQGKITLYFNYSNRVKISIEGSVIGTVAIPLTFKTYNQNLSSTSVMSKGSSGNLLGLDFSDIKGITSVINNTVLILVSGKFNIDPSIVSSSTGAAATQFTPQRKTFHDGTLFWDVFADDTTIKIANSSDGLTWSNTVTLASNLESNSLGSFFSARYYTYAGAKYVYLAWANTTASTSTIFFMRSTINVDETITVGTIYSVFSSGGTSYAKSPDVEENSNGMVFVSYSKKDIGGLTSLWGYCANNTNNDGSGAWSSKGTVMTIGIVGITECSTGLTRLTNGKIYWVTNAYLGKTKGCLWNNNWEASFTTIFTATESGMFYRDNFGLASYGDDVFMSYVNTTGIGINQRPYVSWRNSTSETWVYIGLISYYQSFSGYVSICMNSSNGDQWYFWKNKNNTANDEVMYIHRSYLGVLDSEVSWFTEALDLGENTIGVFSSITDNTIGLTYTTSEVGTKYVMYNVLNFTAVSKAWHDIATWTSTLITRQWTEIALWTQELVTRQWNNLASWNATLITRDWHDLAEWTQTLQTRVWNEIATWQQDPITRMWHTITWLETLAVMGWRDIALWTATLGTSVYSFMFMLLGGVALCSCTFFMYYVRRRRRKEEEEG